MAKRYYLAYGSNLNIAQMRFRCPGARALGTAELDGYELLFKGSKTGSYLTVEKKEKGCVPVAVWEVTPEDEKRLDRYEGYPLFYYKTELEITFTGIKTGKTRTRTAFFYIMHEDRDCGVPTRSYMETCMDGYEDFGFDLKFLGDAYRESKRRLQQKPPVVLTEDFMDADEAERFCIRKNGYTSIHYDGQKEFYRVHFNEEDDKE